jgi:TPR repeat protein
MAADQGFPDAQLNYGGALARGRGVPLDLHEAAHYFKLAADQGHSVAQFNYALALWKGNGIAVDLPGAAHYFKLAADQGLSQAQLNYALAVFLGRGVPVDLRSAAQYFKLAADQNDLAAQFNYGKALFDGAGVAVDHRGAARYFKVAADRGMPIAQLYYGFVLSEGRGVALDVRTAALYFKAAADMGLPAAQLAFAVALFNGRGVPPDPVVASLYFKAVADQGGSPDWGAFIVTQTGGFPRALVCAVLALAARLDFGAARALLADATDELSIALRESLAERLVRREEFAVSPSVFSFVRRAELPAVRVAVGRLRPGAVGPEESRAVRKALAEGALMFLDIFGIPNPDLGECESEEETAKRFLASALREGSLFMRANEGLRLLPTRVIGHFDRLFHGFLSYACLLQFTVETLRERWADGDSVFRGFAEGGRALSEKCRAAVGEVVVWPAFASASRERGRVVREFVKGREGILFEIVLNSGSIVAKLGVPGTEQSDVLIAAESAFRVEGVSEFVVEGGEWAVPCVKLTWAGAWSDGNIDRAPAELLMPRA